MASRKRVEGHALGRHRLNLHSHILGKAEVADTNRDGRTWSHSSRRRERDTERAPRIVPKVGEVVLHCPHDLSCTRTTRRSSLVVLRHVRLLSRPSRQWRPRRRTCIASKLSAPSASSSIIPPLANATRPLNWAERGWSKKGWSKKGWSSGCSNDYAFFSPEMGKRRRQFVLQTGSVELVNGVIADVSIETQTLSISNNS